MKTFWSLCLWHHLSSWKPTDQIGRVSTLWRKILELVSGPWWPLWSCIWVQSVQGRDTFIQMFQRCVELQQTEWWRWRIRGKPAIVFLIYCSSLWWSARVLWQRRKINVSEAKFAWDSRKSSKISSEVVIKCEGWACTIVKDFEPAEKTNRSRSRVQGDNKGMYSSSEASVSRADSPVIFVVGLCFTLIGWLWA